MAKQVTSGPERQAAKERAEKDHSGGTYHVHSVREQLFDSPQRLSETGAAYNKAWEDAEKNKK